MKRENIINGLIGVSIIILPTLILFTLLLSKWYSLTEIFLSEKYFFKLSIWFLIIFSIFIFKVFSSGGKEKH